MNKLTQIGERILETTVGKNNAFEFNKMRTHQNHRLEWLRNWVRSEHRKEYTDIMAKMMKRQYVTHYVHPSMMTKCPYNPVLHDGSLIGMRRVAHIAFQLNNDPSKNPPIKLGFFEDRSSSLPGYVNLNNGMVTGDTYGSHPELVIEYPYTQSTKVDERSAPRITCPDSEYRSKQWYIRRNSETGQPLLEKIDKKGFALGTHYVIDDNFDTSTSGPTGIQKALIRDNEGRHLLITSSPINPNMPGIDGNIDLRVYPIDPKHVADVESMLGLTPMATP